MNNGNGKKSELWPFHMIGRTDVIFVHIPKTAGTSIRFSFKFNDVDSEEGKPKHIQSSDIINLIGQEQWDSSFKFCFVRNPWARLLSHYYFRLRKNRIKADEDRNSFKAWASKKLSSLDPSSKVKFNLQPQVNWQKDQSGKVDMDFIGRFENLEDDFNKLTNLIGLKSRLEKVNQNPNKLKYQDHYDAELQNQVAQFYQEDIDLFKYKF